MRNLKRVLSLALALVMVLGMMVITTSAADFTDAEEITYEEAVEVMAKIGVIDGNPDGTFNPTGTLTREQGAKIICYLLMGKDAAEKLVGSGNFTDVAATRWSAGAIDYCAALDILDGNGDGTFDPTGKLTAVQFGKMLLCALGYDADIEGYVGKNWAVNIAADMVDIGLDVYGVEMDAQLTREQAAEMALYALQSDLVEYETKGTTISVNGMDIVSGASKATAVTSAKDSNTISDETWNSDGSDLDASATNPDTVQFAEKYFPNLALTGGIDDDFGRNALYGWNWKNVPFYNVMSSPVAVYTEQTRSTVVAKDLAGYKLGGNKVNDAVAYYTDGVDNDFTAVGLTVGDTTANGGMTIAKAIADLTANGKLVEVYANGRTKAITEFIQVGYAVDEVKKITVDEKTGDVTYKIGTTDYVDYADVEIADEIVTYAEIAKGDIVTKTSASGVLYVYPTTNFEGTQTATKTERGVQAITVDGTAYTVGAYKTGTFANSNDVATYYVDQYGFVVKTTAKVTASTDYLKVVDVQGVVTPGIDGNAPALKVRAVLADGTVGEYSVAIKNQGGTWKVDGLNTTLDTASASTVASSAAVDNKIFGYVLENGVLTLENLAWTGSSALDADDSGKIFGVAIASFDDNTNQYTVSGSPSNTVLTTKDTVVVVYNDNDKEATVYTGFDTLPDLSAATAKTIVKAGMGTNANITSSVVLFVETTATAKEVNEYVYINHTDYTAIGVGAKATREYTAIAPDGTESTLTLKESDALSATGLYKLNADGTLGSQITLTDAGDTFVQAGRLVVSGDMVLAGDGNFYYMTDDTSVVYINKQLKEVEDNVAIVVLKARSNDIATIFVIAD